MPQPLPTDVTYVAEAWLEGEREAAASRGVSTTLAEVVEPTASIVSGFVEEQKLQNLLLRDRSLWIESVSPEAGTIISETTDVQVVVGYDFDEVVEGMQIFLDFYSRDDKDWAMPRDESFSQSKRVIQRTGSVSFDFSLDPSQAVPGNWDGVLGIGNNTSKHFLASRGEETPFFWCINCLADGTEIVIDRSRLASNEQYTRLILGGLQRVALGNVYSDSTAG